eukprot:1922972-Amphidinium_carterae.1
MASVFQKIIECEYRNDSTVEYSCAFIVLVIKYLVCFVPVTLVNNNPHYIGAKHIVQFLAGGRRNNKIPHADQDNAREAQPRTFMSVLRLVQGDLTSTNPCTCGWIVDAFLPSPHHGGTMRKLFATIPHMLLASIIKA